MNRKMRPGPDAGDDNFVSSNKTQEGPIFFESRTRSVNDIVDFDNFEVSNKSQDDIILVESGTRSVKDIVVLPSQLPNYYPSTVEDSNSSYLEVATSKEEKVNFLNKANFLKCIIIILIVLSVALAFGLGLAIGLAQSSSKNNSSSNGLSSIAGGVDGSSGGSGTMTGFQQSIREDYPYTTVLTSLKKLSRGDVVTSPNNMYSLSFTDKGSLILQKSDSAEILWTDGGEGAIKCFLQPDGNLVLRREDGTVNWKSATQGNPASELQLDDGGQIAIVSAQGVSLWIAGVPRGEYTGQPHESLNFPIRGIFYYPWYPETWTVDGSHVFYNPKYGYYSSGDGDVQQKHVETLDYIHADVAIASWFGPDTHKDRARLTNLLAKSKSTRTKWTVYHEQEFRDNQSVDDIRRDLDYLKKWFVWRDTWAYVEGKPVIFVYNEGDCDVVSRWVEASGGEWYVVLKIFHERDECLSQPDDWHQYGPSTGVHHHTGLGYSISPGFWRADQERPSLPRYSEDKWREMVQDMVDSNEPWQLIVSFNEWGEGTAIESAAEWQSHTDHGYYIDALHDIH
mmetsp:Transcript_6378/g.9391  ORF Transcript_6378/g.9391 Transcript_6378/m.9391 type:complete len:565 (+) Transcript_6378:36-1730(+)